MNFPTESFFIFLTLVILTMSLAGRLLGHRTVLVIASYAFYACWNPWFVLLLFASTLVDYVCALKMKKGGRPWLVLSLSVNLGALALFKYAEFAVEAANDIFGLGVPVPDILLPLGISFFTFQSMSYTIDVYRGQMEPRRSFIDVALFVSFFPQLVAGPIIRARDFMAQLKPKLVGSPEDVMVGCERFVWGLFKKTCIADHLAPVVDTIYATPGAHSGWQLLIGTLAFAVQLYVDFSAYSDMALGLSRVFGFRFPENFNNPYLSLSPREFWQRWHISLSTWLRDYLYIPLGGNRHGPTRTALCLMITMMLGGLWHGAAWGFVAWGMWHGLALGAHRLLSGRIRVPGVVGWALTLLVVMAGWVFFRAQNLNDAITIFIRIGEWFGGQKQLASWMELRPTAALIALVAFASTISRFGWSNKWNQFPLVARGAFVASLFWLSQALGAVVHRDFYYFIF